MALFKCTALMQLTTNAEKPNVADHRIGGWSESVYFNGTLIEAQSAFLNPPCFCSTRADLLPTGAAIIGERIQQIDPVGSTQNLAKKFPGSAGIAADIPQAALLVKVPSKTTANSRPLYLRGVPDARIVQGEYESSKAYDDALKAFFTNLNLFAFKSRDLSQPAVPIKNITDAGLVTTIGAHGLITGNYARILRTKTHDHGNEVGGRFIVVSTPTLDTYTIAAPPWGSSDGGKSRKDLTIYPAMDGTNASLSRVVTRRVGRPFGGYRGRRSKKRF